MIFTLKRKLVLVATTLLLLTLSSMLVHTPVWADTSLNSPQLLLGIQRGQVRPATMWANAGAMYRARGGPESHLANFVEIALVAEESYGGMIWRGRENDFWFATATYNKTLLVDVVGTEWRADWSIEVFNDEEFPYEVTLKNYGGNEKKSYVLRKGERLTFTYTGRGSDTPLMNITRKITGTAEGVAVSTSYSSALGVTINTERPTYWDVEGTHIGWKVTWDSNGGTPVTPASTSVPHDTAVSAPTPPTRSGYVFDGWSTSTSGTSRWNFNTRITEDVTLYARWRENKFTVTYRGNGNTGGSVPANTTHDPNSSVTPASPGNLSRTGYTFEGWNTNSAGTGINRSPETPFTITADVILWAKWTANSYRLDFDKNSDAATAGSTPSKNVTYNSKVGVLPSIGDGAPTRPGYTFAGWATSSTASTANYTAETVYLTAGNSRVYAVWTANKYKLNFDKNAEDATAGTPTFKEVTYGSQVGELPLTGATAPTRPGYILAGWATSSTAPTANYLATFVYDKTEDTTVYAVWTANNYTVSYSPNALDASGNPPVGTTIYAYGSTVTVLGNTGPYTRPGYTFAGWATNAAGTGTIYQAGDIYTMGADNVILYAQWTQGKLNVSYDGNESDSGNVPAGVTEHTYNDLVTVLGNIGTPPFEKLNHEFDSWNTTATGSGIRYEADDTFNITANTILYAQWKKNTYKVTFNSQGGTTVPEQTIEHGEKVTKPADPTKAGYIFAGWYKEEACDNEWNFSSDTVTSTTTLFAKWTARTYTLTFDKGATDAIVGTTISTTVTFGEAVGPLPTGTEAPSRPEYDFAGWATTSGATTVDFTADTVWNTVDDGTVYAVWTKNTYTLTYDVNGEGAVLGTAGAANEAVVHETLISDATYYTLDPSDPKAPTRTGYTFAGWFNDAQCTSTVGTTTMPSAPKTIYAKWDANKYTVTYDGTGSDDGTAPIDDNEYLYKDSVIVLGNKVIDPFTKIGHTFAGWATNAAGTGTIYQAGDIYTMGADNVTFHATWTKNKYTVTYHETGSTGGNAPTDGGEYEYGDPVTVKGNIGIPELERTGYIFDGWNTASDGSGTDLAEGAIFNIGETINLYPKWKATPGEVTIVKVTDQGATLHVADCDKENRIDVDDCGSGCELGLYPDLIQESDLVYQLQLKNTDEVRKATGSFEDILPAGFDMADEAKPNLTAAAAVDSSVSNLKVEPAAGGRWKVTGEFDLAVLGAAQITITCKTPLYEKVVSEGEVIVNQATLEYTIDPDDGEFGGSSTSNYATHRVNEPARISKADDFGGAIHVVGCPNKNEIEKQADCASDCDDGDDGKVDIGDEIEYSIVFENPSKTKQYFATEGGVYDKMPDGVSIAEQDWSVTLDGSPLSSVTEATGATGSGTLSSTGEVSVGGTWSGDTDLSGLTFDVDQNGVVQQSGTTLSLAPGSTLVITVKATVTEDGTDNLVNQIQSGYKLYGDNQVSLDISDSDVMQISSNYVTHQRRVIGVKTQFTKVGADDLDIPLEDAEFALYKWTGTNLEYAEHKQDILDATLLDGGEASGKWIRTTTDGEDGAVTDIFTTLDDGIIDFGTLPDGIYTLIETKAPKSYELPIGQWVMTIDHTKNNTEVGGYQIEYSSKGDTLPPAVLITPGSSGEAPTYRVVNTRPFSIGMSGGLGTRGITILGLAVMLLTGVIYSICNYKKNKTQDKTQNKK